MDSTEKNCGGWGRGGGGGGGGGSGVHFKVSMAFIAMV